MRDHLHGGAGEGDRLGIGLAGNRRASGGQAEDDVAHVVDAGVGDESLHIRLGESDESAVEDGDDSEDSQGQSEACERAGHHRHENANEAVGSHLQENAGQNG